MSVILGVSGLEKKGIWSNIDNLTTFNRLENS